MFRTNLTFLTGALFLVFFIQAEEQKQTVGVAHDPNKIALEKKNLSQSNEGLPEDEFFKPFMEGEASLKNQARECMRSTSFKVILNGHEYRRYVNPMPSGYFYGNLLQFAKNYCALIEKKDTPLSQFYFLDNKNHFQSKSDTLKHISSPIPGTSELVSASALMLSLGMVETDGRFDEARDRGAWNVASNTAEAGLHQSSYNVVPKLVSESNYKALMRIYDDGNSPLCLKNIFLINKPVTNNILSWGWGEGFRFQEAMKKCPALASDLALLIMRKTYEHHGPLIRKHAQIKEACVQVFDALKKQIDLAANPSRYCKNFDSLSAGLDKDPRINNDFGASNLAALPLKEGTYKPYSIDGMAEYKRLPWLESHAKELLRRINQASGDEKTALIAELNETKENIFLLRYDVKALDQVMTSYSKRISKFNERIESMKSLIKRATAAAQNEEAAGLEQGREQFRAFVKEMSEDKEDLRKKLLATIFIETQKTKIELSVLQQNALEAKLVLTAEAKRKAKMLEDKIKYYESLKKKYESSTSKT